MRALTSLPFVTIAVAGCVNSATTVTQAGVVPAPRPLAFDGQPLPKPIRIEGRYGRVLTELEPNTENDSGDYIARDHMGFSLAMRSPHSENSYATASVDLARSKGAEPVNPGFVDKPDDGAWSFLFGARHSLPISPQMRLGLAVDLGFVSVPVRLGGSETEHDFAFAAGIGLVPSWRSGPLSLFGGLHVVSEIDVPRTLVVDDASDAPDARADGGAVVLTAGASVQIDGGLYLRGQLAKPMASDYADHGMQLDVALGFDFGTTAQPARPAPAGPPPGYYAPPPPYTPPPPSPYTPLPPPPASPYPPQ